MNPHFFFEGKLAREEAASAFLATLLEQKEDFRDYFFNCLSIEQPKGFREVKTECNNLIDIMLFYEDYIVLIENKIKPSSFRSKQILDYYLSEREKKSNNDKKIYTILLSPNEGIGESEIENVRKSENFNKNDYVGKISWQTLSGYTKKIEKEDPYAEFIISFFELIINKIQDSFNGKYPIEGYRKIAKDIIIAALQQILKEFPDLEMLFWNAKNLVQIYTIRTDITVYINFIFDIENDYPFSPIGITEDNCNATIETKFKLSGRGKRNSAMREWWNEMLEKKEYNGYVLDSGKWFTKQIPSNGTFNIQVQNITNEAKNLFQLLKNNQA